MAAEKTFRYAIAWPRNTRNHSWVNDNAIKAASSGSGNNSTPAKYQTLCICVYGLPSAATSRIRSIPWAASR